MEVTTISLSEVVSEIGCSTIQCTALGLLIGLLALMLFYPLCYISKKLHQIRDKFLFSVFFLSVSLSGITGLVMSIIKIIKS